MSAPGFADPARQTPDASNRLRPAFSTDMIGGGTWEGAHARHETAGVRQPVRRRGHDVAAGGARTAAGGSRSAYCRLDRGGEHDAQAHLRAAAFREALREFGWIEGRNISIEYHWG